MQKLKESLKEKLEELESSLNVQDWPSAQYTLGAKKAHEEVQRRA